MVNKIVFIIFILVSCSSFRQTNNFSYLLVDDNEFKLEKNYGKITENIFLLRNNYKLEKVEFFCNQLANLVETEEVRRDNYKINNPNIFNDNGGVWKRNEIMFEELEYPILVKGGSYKVFERMSTGEVIKEIKIKSNTYNKAFPNQDTTVYYTYKIVKHYW